MKHTILVLSLAIAGLSGCAQLREWYFDAESQAQTGASAEEQSRPYPKSVTDVLPVGL